MEWQTNLSAITQLGSGPLSAIQRIKPIVKPKSASKKSGRNRSCVKQCEIVEVFYDHWNPPELENVTKIKSLVDSSSRAIFFSIYRKGIIPFCNII